MGREKRGNMGTTVVGIVVLLNFVKNKSCSGNVFVHSFQRQTFLSEGFRGWADEAWVVFV